MKIGILRCENTPALDNIFIPLTKELQKFEDVVYAYESELENSSPDIVHLTHCWIDGSHLAPVITMNVNHIESGKEERCLKLIELNSPEKIVVTDTFYQQRLGQLSLTNVVYIPQAFDHSGFYPLTFPDKFTIGWLGTNWAIKRFEIAKQAAEELGIAFIDGSRKDFLETNSPLWLADKIEFFQKISCYVVTTFTDTGPLPPQEALLYNRPVISTVVGMMKDIIKPGYNGEFFDGSVEDLKKVIKTVQSRFNLYRAAALTKLPTVENIAKKFLDMWRGL